MSHYTSKTHTLISLSVQATAPTSGLQIGSDRMVELEGVAKLNWFEDENFAASKPAKISMDPKLPLDDNTRDTLLDPSLFMATPIVPHF